MREGRYARLYDSILVSEVLIHPQHLQLLVYLIATASRERRPVGKGRKVQMPNGERQLAAGQVTISQRDLAETLNRSKSSIQRSLEYLKKRTTIKVETGPLFSVVTLVNWPDCQPDWSDAGPPIGPPSGPEPDHDRTILIESENLRLIQMPILGTNGNGTRHRKQKATPARVYASEPDFLRFWKIYPNGADKDLAFDAWREVRPPIDEVLTALAWQTLTPEFTPRDDHTVLYAVRYIERHRWNDDPPKPKKHSTKSSVRVITTEEEERLDV